MSSETQNKYVHVWLQSIWSASLVDLCHGKWRGSEQQGPDTSHFRTVPERFLLKAGSPEPRSLVPAADHPIASKSKVSQTGEQDLAASGPFLVSSPFTG